MPRPSPIPSTERSRIIARYTAGESVNSLAQDYGCSWAAIANIVREQGVFRGHKHRGGFTRREEDDIVRRYQEGTRAGVLAQEYECSYQPINRILKDRGVFEPGRLRVGAQYNKQQVRDMVREYNEGASIYAVARRFGGSPNGVWKVLRAHGVQFRDNLQLRQGRHGKGAKFVCLDCGSHNVAAAEL